MKEPKPKRKWCLWRLLACLLLALITLGVLALMALPGYLMPKH